MYLSEINIYPIKSLAGISLKEAKIERRGLEFDRRWLLVDETNKFLTQREFPKMAALKTETLPGGLRDAGFVPSMVEDVVGQLDMSDGRIFQRQQGLVG